MITGPKSTGVVGTRQIISEVTQSEADQSYILYFILSTKIVDVLIFLFKQVADMVNP